MKQAELHIVAGFLGSGKTTFLQKLLKTTDLASRVAICENEYGEVGLDGLEFKSGRFELLELNAGCICCTLGPSLVAGLKILCARFQPDQIILEPTGLAGLADIREVLADAGLQKLLNVKAALAVISGKAFEHDMPRFEKYYRDMIASASCVYLNRTEGMSPEGREQLLGFILEHNFHAPILEDPLDEADLWTVLNRSALPPNGEPQPRRWLSTFKETAMPTGWPGSRERLEAFFAGNHQCGDILRVKGFVMDAAGTLWRADYAGGALELKPAYDHAVEWLQFVGRNLAVTRLKSFFEH